MPEPTEQGTTTPGSRGLTVKKPAGFSLVTTGDAMLVAPVLRPLEDSATRSLYLPRGSWIDYWSKERIESSGVWIEREVDLDTMPIYVRAGHIIPYGEERIFTGNTIGPVTELEVYGANASLQYDDTEKQFGATWDGEEFHREGLSDETRVSFY